MFYRKHCKIKHRKGILETMIFIKKIHRNLSGNKTDWDCHYIITGIITGKKNVLFHKKKILLVMRNEVAFDGLSMPMQLVL